MMAALGNIAFCLLKKRTVIHKCPVKIARVFSIKGLFDKWRDLLVSNCFGAAKKVMYINRSNVSFNEYGWFVVRVGYNRGGSVWSRPYGRKRTTPMNGDPR